MKDLSLSFLSRGCGRFVSSNKNAGGRDGRLDVCFTPQVLTAAALELHLVLECQVVLSSDSLTHEGCFLVAGFFCLCSSTREWTHLTHLIPLSGTQWNPRVCQQDYYNWKSQDSFLQLSSSGRLLQTQSGLPKTFSTRRGPLLLYSQVTCTHLQFVVGNWAKGHVTSFSGRTAVLSTTVCLWKSL